jgi:hypothetical protein
MAKKCEASLTQSSSRMPATNLTGVSMIRAAVEKIRTPTALRDLSGRSNIAYSRANGMRKIENSRLMTARTRDHIASPIMVLLSLSLSVCA